MRRLGYAVFLAFGMLLAALSPALAQDPPSRTTIHLAQEYWLYENGQQVGPLAFQQVLDRIATGATNRGTQVWTSHLNAWVMIDTMPEFASAIAEAPTEYWVFDNNTQFGPLSRDEVLDRIERGESNSSTQVWTMALNAWVMLSTVPEFAEALSGEPPAVAEGAPYYLFEFDEQKGPFSKAHLIEQISIGNIGKSGFVWTPGMTDWVGIETVPEFAAAFAPEVEIAKPYYVIANGEQVGPLTDSEMRIRILDGLSGAEDLAWKQGLDDWTPLGDFPELADALAAVAPPPLPVIEKDGPPPLPGKDKIGIEVTRPIEEPLELARLLELLEQQLPNMVPTAPARARGEALECLSTELRALTVPEMQVLIESNLVPTEAQQKSIETAHPGFVAAITACTETAEEMRDALDAVIWEVVDSNGAGVGAETLLEAYACLREAVDPLSDADRERVAAEGLDLSEATIAEIEQAYPGVSAAVEACEEIIESALRPEVIDGPTIGDQPEVDDQPNVGGQPPVIVQPKIGISDGPEVIEEKKPVDEQKPVVEEKAKTTDERLREMMDEVYAVQAADIPKHIRDQIVSCIADNLRVLTEAEKELMIANKMGLSNDEMAAVEAAHPGLGAGMEACVPRF